MFGVAKLDAGYIFHWQLGELNIAVRYVDAAGQRVQDGYRPIGAGSNS